MRHHGLPRSFELYVQVTCPTCGEEHDTYLTCDPSDRSVGIMGPSIADTPDPIACPCGTIIPEDAILKRAERELDDMMDDMARGFC